jgi:GT2 family glycosyltransferase
MKILIVIVLYEQKLEQAIAYNSIVQGNDGEVYNYKFYIHDNSADEQINQNQNIYYVHSKVNVGLSKAYNAAAQYAKKNGFDRMLLSDQDTNYPPEILKDYLQAINNNQNIKLIVPKVRTLGGMLLSPCIYKHKRGRPLKDITSGKHNLKSMSVINSGILINVDCFLDCGGYDEKIPIDLSDHQFIERLMKRESVFYVIDREILQDYSNETTDANKMYSRFVRNIEAVKNIKREKVIDKIDYFVFLMKHSTALFLRTGQFRFLKVFFSDYVCCRKNK